MAVHVRTVAALCLVACASSPPASTPIGTDPPGTTDTTAPTDLPPHTDSERPPLYGDAAVDGCTSVCWAWQPPVEALEPYRPEALPIRGCNAFGLLPGHCPEGTVCVWDSAPHSPGTPEGVCRANGSDLSFELDLAEVPVEPAPVAVSLSLTLNGGAWPADESSPGWLALFPRGGGAATRLPLPADDAALETELPTGGYDVFFEPAAGAPATQVPALSRAGVLAVEAEGAEVIDVEAATLRFVVQQDGVPLTAVPEAWQTLAVSATGPHGPRVSRVFRGGDALPEPLELIVAPGSWTPSVEARVASLRDAPHAVVDHTRVELAPTADHTTTTSLDLVDVSGTIRLDGEWALPASDGLVRFGEGSGTTFEVDATGAWSGQVFDLARELWLVTSVPSHLESTVPQGQVRLSPAVRPQALPEAFAVTSSSTEVQLSVSHSPGGYPDRAARLNFEAPHARSSLDVEDDPPTTVSGRVFGTRGDVTWLLQGASTHPDVELLTGVTFDGTHQASFSLVRAQVALHVDGQPATASWTTQVNPWEDDAGVPAHAYLRLHPDPNTPSTPDSWIAGAATYRWPTGDAPQVTVDLPAGTYAVGQLQDPMQPPFVWSPSTPPPATWRVSPVRTVRLDDVTVSEGAQLVADVVTVPLSFTLLDDGAPLAGDTDSDPLELSLDGFGVELSPDGTASTSFPVGQRLEQVHLSGDPDVLLWSGIEL